MAPLLRTLGVEVELTTMPFGDVAWIGLGHNGDPVSVGLEIKTIDDCIACIQSGRFAGHQLPGLLQSYDHIWLLVQGESRMAANGMLQQRKVGRGGGTYWSDVGGGVRKWMWRDFEGWLNSMSILGGLRIHRVNSWEEGAQWIKCLHNWFQRDDHKSTQVIYGGKQLYAETALMIKPSLARRVAKELPNIGTVRSAAVASQFKTLADMVEASEKDWMHVEGLGKATAKRVYAAIHGQGMNGHKS